MKTFGSWPSSWFTEMCGRYYIDQEEDIVEMRRILEELNRRYFGQDVLSQLRTGEIFPSHVVPILQRDGSGEIRPALMRWGLAKSFGSGDLINARAETATEKPSFKQAFLQGRVLIPANAFFEWKSTKEAGSKAKKQKVKIEAPQQETFYMAGLSRRDEQSQGEGSFAIITTAAGPDVLPVHHRQPLILPRSALKDYLLSETTARELLQRTADMPLRLLDLA